MEGSCHPTFPTFSPHFSDIFFPFASFSSFFAGTPFHDLSRSGPASRPGQEQRRREQQEQQRTLQTSVFSQEMWFKRTVVQPKNHELVMKCHEMSWITNIIQYIYDYWSASNNIFILVKMFIKNQIPRLPRLHDGCEWISIISRYLRYLDWLTQAHPNLIRSLGKWNLPIWVSLWPAGKPRKRRKPDASPSLECGSGSVWSSWTGISSRYPWVHVKEPAGPGILSVNFAKRSSTNVAQIFLVWCRKPGWRNFLRLPDLASWKIWRTVQICMVENMISCRFSLGYNPDMVAQGGRRTPFGHRRKTAREARSEGGRACEASRGKLIHPRRVLKPKKRSHFSLSFKGINDDIYWLAFSTFSLVW